MTIAGHTLGCKLNFAETSYLIGQFVDAGWQRVDFDDVADLYVINTCTVTAIAERKCRNAIRQAVAKNPKAIVAVIGCFAQNAADEIAKIDGVDIILGNDQKHNLLQYVQGGNRVPAVENPLDFHLAYSHADRTRTFFKIQDGCDYYCSYCAIPFARGRSRSATIAETVAMAREIAASGAKEVVLTGVNTGTFGQQNGETLLQLIKELDGIEGIERYRISSIEPNLLTDEIIDYVAKSRRFLPHFHIPLQAGSDKVLKMMHRRYDTAFYSNLLARIKAVMPDACIAADIMAGFNGEDDEEFDKVKAFVETLPISYLHVFTFSERPRTAALRMEGRIDVHHRREHSRQLQEISDRKKEEFYKSQEGKVRPVLWESDVKDGVMFGFTDNYIRVSQPATPENLKQVNTVTPFRICS
jgi:threonylcarbamoyladenosine tRNA methylthiotransferase MtaB